MSQFSYSETSLGICDILPPLNTKCWMLQSEIRSCDILYPPRWVAINYHNVEINDDPQSYQSFHSSNFKILGNMAQIWAQYYESLDSSVMSHRLPSDSQANCPSVPTSDFQEGLSDEAELWVIKHGPKCFKELLSDDNINLNALKWLKQWDSYVFASASSQLPDINQIAMKKNLPTDNSLGERPSSASRIGILVGPTGVGKTALAYILAKHCGYDILEIDASSTRSAQEIRQLLERHNKAKRSKTISQFLSPSPIVSHHNEIIKSQVEFDWTGKLMRPKCLILDGIDELTSAAVAAILKSDLHYPLFCTLTDWFSPHLRELRKHCAPDVVWYFHPFKPEIVRRRLQEVLHDHHVPSINDSTLAELISGSGSDIRFCLNTLQFVSRMPNSKNVLLKMIQEGNGKDTHLPVAPVLKGIFTRRDQRAYERAMERWTENSPLSSFKKQDDISSFPHRASHMDLGFLYHFHHVNERFGLGNSAGHHLVQGLIDGMYQQYLCQPYIDTSGRKTSCCVSWFAFNDILTTITYYSSLGNGGLLFGLCDTMSAVLAAMVFLSCSTREGPPPPPHSKPMTEFLYNQQIQTNSRVAYSFRDGLSHHPAVSSLLPFYWKGPSFIAMEITPWLYGLILHPHLAKSPQTTRNEANDSISNSLPDFPPSPHAIHLTTDSPLAWTITRLWTYHLEWNAHEELSELRWKLSPALNQLAHRGSLSSGDASSQGLVPPKLSSETYQWLHNEKTKWSHKKKVSLETLDKKNPAIGYSSSYHPESSRSENNFNNKRSREDNGKKYRELPQSLPKQEVPNTSKSQINGTSGLKRFFLPTPTCGLSNLLQQSSETRNGNGPKEKNGTVSTKDKVDPVFFHYKFFNGATNAVHVVASIDDFL